MCVCVFFKCLIGVCMFFIFLFPEAHQVRVWSACCFFLDYGAVLYFLKRF